MVLVKTIEKDIKWLRKKSREVEVGKENIAKDIKILEEYCVSNGVFGMAAIQLGIAKRIIYIKNTDLKKIDDDDWNEEVILINPVIIKMKGLTEYWEACASCLDNMGLVLRPYKIVINYLDINGKKHQKTFKGFPATVLAHEYDHLDGILHMDKAIDLKIMPAEERREFRKKHDYKIWQKEGDFLELEEKWQKRLKLMQCVY